MRSKVLLIAVLASAIVAVAAPRASAEVAPGLTVSLPLNSPLGSVLHAEAHNGDPSRLYEATIHTYLRVGRKRIADLGQTFVPASVRSSSVPIAVPGDVRASVRREAARTGHRRARVAFVIRARDTVTGGDVPIFVDHSVVRLGSGEHVSGPTRVSIVEQGLLGGHGQLLDGDVFISAPRRWLRTSTPGATTATFGPINVTPRCRATIVVWTIALTARKPLADRGAAAQPNAARASVVTTGTYLKDPSTQAIGVQRFARHRYAGVRINVDYQPGCPTAAAQARTLLTPLREVIGTVRVHVRRVRQAPLTGA